MWSAQHSPSLDVGVTFASISKGFWLKSQKKKKSQYHTGIKHTEDVFRPQNRRCGSLVPPAWSSPPVRFFLSPFFCDPFSKATGANRTRAFKTKRIGTTNAYAHCGLPVAAPTVSLQILQIRSLQITAKEQLLAAACCTALARARLCSCVAASWGSAVPPLRMR